MNEIEEKLVQGIEDLSLHLPGPLQIKLLATYQLLFLKWNKTINLSAHRESAVSIEKNFLDCIYLSSLISEKKILDFGSGGGFPGLVLAILNSKRDLILVESDKKKSAFLKTIMRELDLTNVEIIPEHIDVKKPLKILSEKNIEIIVSRATISGEDLMLLGSSLLSKQGRLLLMLSEKQSEEMKVSQNTEYECEKEISYLLPWSKIKRKILIFRKKCMFE